MSTPAPSPPLEPDRRLVCPCCGLRKGIRQIQRHLRALRARELAELGPDSNSEDNDNGDNDVNDGIDLEGDSLVESDLGGDNLGMENGTHYPHYRSAANMGFVQLPRAGTAGR
jgi:hypothetical protein